MPDESTPNNRNLWRRGRERRDAASSPPYRNPFLQNQKPEGPTGPTRPPVAPNVDEGRYFDPNLSEGARLLEDNQPCLICTGKINNKGEYQKDVRPRQCFTCKKLFHYTCLGDWFIKCPLTEPTCPACRTEWRYKGDVVYLKKKAREREKERMRIEAIERETRQTTNQAPPTNFVAVTRPQGGLARLCSLLTPRRSRRRVAPSGGKRRRRKKTCKKRRKTKRKKRRRKKKKSRRRKK